MISIGIANFRKKCHFSSLSGAYLTVTWLKKEALFNLVSKKTQLLKPLFPSKPEINQKENDKH